MLLGQKPLLLKREGDKDEAQEAWAFMGEEEPPSQESRLVSARSPGCPALSPAPSFWLSQQLLCGWGCRNILLYKMGSLITFGTFKQPFSF